MWWTLFVLPMFYGVCVEVLVHLTDLSYLSFVKSIVVSLSQESAIERCLMAIVEIVKDVVESFDGGRLIEVLHTSFVETVHTDYLAVVVSKLSDVIFWNKGLTVGTVNENVVSHLVSNGWGDVYSL